jgi:tetratricopeptide (TPR) repeat protein
VSRPDRLPWEVVETFPSTDQRLIDTWDARVREAPGPHERARALIGRALARYWAVQEGVVEASWTHVATTRADDLDEARRLAHDGPPDLRAEALLGALYGRWGPDHLDERPGLVAELVALRPHLDDEELRLRVREWVVLAAFDAGDLEAAEAEVERFAREAADTELVLFRRREVLWRGNLAMLRGRLDESLQLNQDAISATSHVAGSPFSFQNVAITLAIERFLRRGLADVVDALRSIRASSPRVGANWDTGLAFALTETGQLDEAGALFEHLAADGFAAVHRDLNWLVTTQLLALVALALDDRARCATLRDELGPFAHLDATHGSGYASYGPVGRVVGALDARLGDHHEAELRFAEVLATRPPGPWTSLTRLDRARARAAPNPSGALDDARVAEAELRALGLDSWADEAAGLAAGLRLGGLDGPLARLGADGRWRLQHPAGATDVRDGVGVRHLVRLLARPGHDLQVTELDPTTPERSTVSEGTLDGEARRAYRRRLAELDARSSPTDDEAAEADWLRRALAGATHVRAVAPEVERARVRVTRALHRAVDAVEAGSPGLGRHLRESLRTGRRCGYHPADGVAWTIERAHPTRRGDPPGGPTT